MKYTYTEVWLDPPSPYGNMHSEVRTRTRTGSEVFDNAEDAHRAVSRLNKDARSQGQTDSDVLDDYGTVYYVTEVTKPEFILPPMEYIGLLGIKAYPHVLHDASGPYVLFKLYKDVSEADYDVLVGTAQYFEEKRLHFESNLYFTQERTTWFKPALDSLIKDKFSSFIHDVLQERGEVPWH